MADDVLEIDRLALAKALYAAGAYCGDCEYEGWDSCQACREVNRTYADAVIKLGWGGVHHLPSNVEGLNLAIEQSNDSEAPS